MKMNELVDAANIIYEEAGEDANVIFGCVTDDRLNDSQEIHVTVVATGINSEESKQANPSYYNNYTKSNDYFDKKEEEAKENSDSNILPEPPKEENVQNILENNQLSIDSSNQEKENNENFTFGDDDLEVPAFLRNNN